MPSPLDIVATVNDTKELIDAVRRRYSCNFQVRFVINGLDPRTSAAREILETRVRLRPPATRAFVRRLSSFVHAANNAAVTRMNSRARKAKEDIETLIKELLDERLITL
jgi:Flp pilus assembly CpaE family ATPase